LDVPVGDVFSGDGWPGGEEAEEGEEEDKFFKHKIM